MKTPLTPELRRAANEMLELRRTRQEIAVELGISVGQVSALAAHRTMRQSQKSSSPTPPASAPKMPVVFKAEKVDTSSAIQLGGDSEGEPAVWDPRSEPNPHLLVVGESGSGKTFAISNCVTKLQERGFSSIIFDFGQGFNEGTLVRHLNNPHDAIHIDIARSGSALNPLSFSSSDPHGPLTSAQRIADSLCRVFPHLGIQQNAAIREALLSTYRKAGIFADDPATWLLPTPSFEAFGETLKDWLEDRLFAGRKTVGSLYAHISPLFLFRLFRDGGASLKWPEIMSSKQITVIHLRGLSLELQRALTEFLLWSLIGSVEAKGPDELKLFVILDEAHRVPSNPGSALDFLLREGRKYGIAAVIGSQQPEDFSSVCLTNTASKLVLNVGEQKPATLRKLFRGTSSAELQTLQANVPKLSRGHGYLVSSAGIRHLKI